MTRKLFVVVAVAGLVIASVAAQKHELGPFAGTWKLNIEKSKDSSGPLPKSLTLKWEPAPSGFVFVVEGINAQGKPTRISTNAAFDGRDYPLEGSPQKTMRTYRRIDERTFEETDKVNGKAMVTRRIAVSPDGKAVTVTLKGTNAQGQPVSGVRIYEKQ